MDAMRACVCMSMCECMMFVGFWVSLYFKFPIWPNTRFIIHFVNLLNSNFIIFKGNDINRKEFQFLFPQICV